MASAAMSSAAACLIALLWPHAAAAKAPYDLLYSFSTGRGGQSPSTPLLQGPSGILYGATGAGGAHGQGTLYSFDTGKTRLTPVYEFPRKGQAGPNALAIGADGTLYGTLQFGAKDGAIFKLDPATGAYTTLYTFKPGQTGKFGFYPAAIAVDRNNTVFGQTFVGGPGHAGTVFELTSAGTLRVLLAPGSSGASIPGAIALIGDELVGVLCEQANGTGSVYAIPTGSGQPTTLYHFSGGADGGCPSGAVAQAGAGLFDGFTVAGGSSGTGVIYQINQSTGAETVLFNLPVQFSQPLTAILPGPHGIIYGIQNMPGAVYAFDTVKQTATQLGGAQGEQDLQSALPLAGLVLQNGELFGVTLKGGSTNLGTIFTVSP